MAVEEIGFYGGMALLISSITGPGLTTIPLLFQQAGWFSPTFAFILFGAISAVVSLFLVETMSAIRGNETFQARVEYSTIAHLYLGQRAHIFMQVLLYCALQSVNISSIIISEQTMDSLLIRLFHKTCALSFTKGWVCVSEIDSTGSPFDSYILFSFGYLISVAMVLPLSMMSLVGNIKFQLASVATLFFVMTVWIYLFANNGFNHDVPAVGSNQRSLMGFVLSNFAFITTVPSFINELSRRVSIHKSIVVPIVVCIILYIIIGLTGAASFRIDPSSDILAALSAADKNKALIVIVNILFPISVLVTSVPVFAIVIRYNLVRGNFCSNRWAILWASVMPWIFIIPFQTKGWLTLVMNWSSLIFGSTTNFVIPLLLYLSSKIHDASTIDTEGGDIFVLRRDNSLASAHSRSTHTAGVALTLEIPSSLTTPTPNGEELPPYNNPASPIVVVTSPTGQQERPSSDGRSSKKSNEEIDIVDVQLLASESGFDQLSDPLRVVYSPAVSRTPSIGPSSHSSKRPAVVNQKSDPPESSKQIITPITTSPTAFQAPLSLDNQSVRRRSSTASNIEAGLPSSNEHPSSLHRPMSRGSLIEMTSQSRHSGEDYTLSVFKAFPKSKRLREGFIAKAALGIVTCCVLLNLIYTIVETARGHSPIG